MGFVSVFGTQTPPTIPAITTDFVVIPSEKPQKLVESVSTAAQCVDCDV